MAEALHPARDVRCGGSPDAAAPGAFTVVIPAFNAERYVRETLASAASSGAGLSEIIVVDDGSTDATAAVVAAAQGGCPRVSLIRQGNGGVARARNAGLARVATDYVCFLDADDLLRPGALDALSLRLDARADAAAAFGGVAYIDPDSNPHPAAIPPKRPQPCVGLVDVMSENIIDTPGAVLFRTACLREAGGFRPGLAMAEDWEVYVRVALRGAFVASDETVLDYRVHPVSAIRRPSLRMEDFEPALREVFGDASRYAGRVDPAALRRAENRNRAHILRILNQNSTSAAKSLGLIAQFGRLAVLARFDRRVVGLGVRAVLRLGKGLLAGGGARAAAGREGAR